MASIIRIKRSASAGNPGTLGAGELAYSSLANPGFTGGTPTGGGMLRIGMGTETTGNAANHIVIGGEYYTAAIDNATSSNTAYTLVKRDASGNFTAGNITATTFTVGTGGSIVATGALTLSAGGSNTNVILAPLGTGTVDVSSARITSLANPTQATDAATKSYVDAVKTGLYIKDAVRLATAAALTVTYANGTSGVGATLTNAGTQAVLTLDSVPAVVGDRVLVKDQAAGTQNGIYTVTSIGSVSTNWVLTRATDFDNNPTGEVAGGDFVFVQEGTSNADSGYVVTTNGAITVGTTDITWAQFSGAGQITAGDGLTKTGNTLKAVGTASRISVSASGIDISGSYAGQNTIITLGTVTTGTWNGSIIGGTYGGTGVNNGASTITIAGNVTHAGAFARTFTATGATTLTLPTAGTLATLTGTETLTNKTLDDSTTIIQDNTNPLKLLRIEAASVGGSGAQFSVTTSAGGVVTAINATPVSGGTGYAVNDIITLEGPGSPSSKVSITVATVTAGTGAILTFTTSTLASSLGYTASQTGVTAATALGSAIATRVFAVPGASTTLVGTDSVQSLTNKTLSTGSAWNGSVITGTYGGTGVNNGSNTITLGGNLTTSGAFATTLTSTAATNVTLPTTGTLATLTGTETLTNKTLTDSTTTFQDEITNGKKAQLQLSSIGGTGLTITWTGGTGGAVPAIVTIAAAGIGYQTNDVVTVTGGSSTATFTVTTVDAAGGVTSLTQGVAGTTYGATGTSNATTVSTYQTRFLTLPATSGTIATLAGAEALSNKAITSSTFSGTTVAASGNVTFTNTTDVTVLGTAPVVLSGGLSVAKAIFVGTNITGAGVATSKIDGFEIDCGTY